MATGPNYRVEFSSPAAKVLVRLSRKLQERIGARIDDLATDPRSHGTEKLEGEDNKYRVRVGSYRIIYEIHDDVLVVLVLRIGHRRDVYRKK